ncbi:MAG TPA: chlorite dismutase family protein [Nitrososphaeraceae archaeon]|jgi:chlorite dismutase
MSLSVENEGERSSHSSALYLNYSFFKIDQKWRWLNDIGKEEAAKELSTLIDVANTKMKVRTYSSLGLRHDIDFMLWMISDSVEKFQILASKIYSTVVGKYIETSLVYLSAYRRSIYSNNTIKPRFMGDNQPMKYLVVYPFIKSREWYLLPLDDRKMMMEEHIAIGKKFPQVQINTSYSFGIHDQDFTLAFETDDLMAFQDLIIQLRETKVSRYVIKDTPMIVCVHKPIDNIVRSLG